MVMFALKQLERAHFDGFGANISDRAWSFDNFSEVILIAQETASRSIMDYIREVSPLSNLDIDVVTVPDDRSEFLV